MKNERIFVANFINKTRKNLLNFRLKSGNKRFWRTIKSPLSGKFIQVSAMTHIHNKNLISDRFELDQT